LLKVSGGKSILLGKNLVDVFSAEVSNLITTVSVVNTEEAQALLRRRWPMWFITILEVEDGSMGIFHGDTPALHTRDAVDESVIRAGVGELESCTQQVSQLRCDPLGIQFIALIIMGVAAESLGDNAG